MTLTRGADPSVDPEVRSDHDSADRGIAVGQLWDAGLLFLAASLLLAAVRGYAGRELLAVSDWVRRRDDQLGCVVLSPIDQLEAARQPDRA